MTAESAAPQARDPYLEGNYAPIQEEIHAPQLEVIGELPADLAGMFVRNGSNPRFEPQGRYHWFDGDGMIHGVHLAEGRASYRNRYVRTEGLAAEEKAGHSLWTGIMENPDFGNPNGPFKDTGNTDLVFHGGKLLALWWLGGKARIIELPGLETRGIDSFGGKLTTGVSAHPKLDPRTGELAIFDFGPVPPYLTYGVVSAEGELVHHTEIELSGQRLQHDTALTERYTLLFDMSMMFDPKLLAQGKTRMIFRRDEAARIGVLPRHGDGASIRWFEVSPFFMYHTINAWEEGDEVVLVGCKIDNPLTLDPTAPPQPEHVPSLGMLRLEPYLHRWRLNMKTGEAKEQTLDDRYTEFPRMNNLRLGERTRYSYNPRVAPASTLLFDGFIKYDLEKDSSEVYEYPAGWYGGETCFAPAMGGSAEDDGYIVTFVAEEATGRSELYILDARRIEDGPVARLPIPQRVPTGYHSWWVSAADLAGQRVG
jgi:carotenoid cleavage dioxygenase-like enzyme